MSDVLDRLAKRPPLACSRGGVPYNDFHLREKDAEIARLQERIQELQRELDGRDCIGCRNGWAVAIVSDKPQHINEDGDWVFICGPRLRHAHSIAEKEG